MWFGLLGPLVVRDHAGTLIDLGGRQPRTMLAMLLVADGRAVTIDALREGIWGDDLPPSSTGTLQSYVSRLRRRLADGAALRHDDAGYRLELVHGHVDAHEFEAAVRDGRAALAAGDPARALDSLAAAEALWRGPVLAEFADVPFLVGFAARLEETRLAATEDRMEAMLQLGLHAGAVGALGELVAAHPLRERLQHQFALALYRSNRQSEALRAIADAGALLRDELGVDPGRPLRELESAILRQDPALDLPPAAGPSASPSGVARPAAASVGAPVVAGAAARPGRGTAAASDGARPADARLDLIGRDAELAQLLDALDECATDARIAIVEGEPGIGKSRLADALAAAAGERGALAVWGRSDEGGAAPALWPWLAPLRALAEHVAVVPDVLVDLLQGEATMGAGTADSQQFERFVAVADLLQTAAATRAVVVLLDDLQWADATSLELLAFLAGRSLHGVLIVGTVRRLEVGRNDAVTDALAAVARRPGSRRLRLRGLAPDATAAVLRHVTARAVSESAARAIHERSEGNPFYAIELARLIEEEPGSGHEVPVTIGDVIRRRLARLPAPTVELLTVAAVVGRDVDVLLLAAAAGRPMDEVLDDLEPAVEHRILVDAVDGMTGVRFSHALVREVLLDDLTALRRARLHLRVADAIEARGASIDEAEILAEHLWRAAAIGVGRRAADALERAAEVAIRRVSYAAAEDLLTKATRLRRVTSASAEDHEAELTAIYRLLEVARARRYFQGANSPEVIGRAKDLAERLGQRHVLLDMLWFEWSSYATATRVVEAAPLAVVYAQLSDDDPDPEVRAIGHEVMGVAHWCAGRISDAVAALDRANALLEGLGPPRSPFAAEKRMIVLVFTYWNRALAGLADRATTYASFAALTDHQPDRFVVTSVCGFAATTAVTLGDWDEVQRFVAISALADPGSQFAFWGGQLEMLEAIADARLGPLDEAIEAFERGRARYTGIGARSALATYEASMAIVLAERGRLPEAQQMVARAVRELETYEERWNAAIVHLAEAVVHEAAGDADAAAERFAHAIDVAEAQGAHALAARVRDRREQARR